MSSNSTPNHASNRIRTSQRRPLACQECTKRKVKCDKQQPCSRCQRYGLQCAREIVKIKHNMVQNAAEVRFLQSVIQDLEATPVSGNVQSTITKMKRRIAQLEFGDELLDNHGASSSQEINSLQHPNEPTHQSYDPSLLTTLEHIAWGRTSGNCFPHTSCSCNLTGSLQMESPFWAALPLSEGISRYIPSSEARRLVHFHSHHVAWHHNCVHSPTFEAECEHFWQTGSCNDQIWLALYLSVLSATIFAIQSSEKARMQVSVNLELVPSALELFTGMVHVLYSCQFLQSASLYAVQAIVISTEVAHPLGQSQINAMLFSSVVGIAERIGLHQISATPVTDEDTWKLEVGKRVLCQMMIQDHFAIFFTNSYRIFPGRVSTPSPFNSDDLDLNDMPNDIPTVSSYGLTLLEIAKLMPRFLDGLSDGGIPKPLDTQYQHVLNMDHQMRETVKKFPVFFLRQDVEKESILPWLSIARKSLAITAAEKIIMIHRPFLFRSFCSPLYEHTRRTCTAAASTILREHEALVMADDISIWTHTAFCITAAVILCFAIHYLRDDERSLIEQHKETLFAAMKRLDQRKNDILAQRGATLINILLDELPRGNLVDIVPRVLGLFNSLDTTNAKLPEDAIAFDISHHTNIFNTHPVAEDLELDMHSSDNFMEFSNWFNNMFGNLH